MEMQARHVERMKQSEKQSDKVHRKKKDSIVLPIKFF